MIKLKGYIVKYKKLRGFLSMTNYARRVCRAFMPLRATATARSAAPLGSRFLVRGLLILVLLSGLLTMPSRNQAQACGDYCICETIFHGALRGAMTFMHGMTNAFITAQFIAHREIFWEEWMWKWNIANALMMWTNELSSTAMAQMFAVGAFFDAKHQLETQRLLQMKMADAYRDYHPDIEMCTIGTVARSLGANSRKSEMVAYAIVENQIDRLTNARNSSAHSGPSSDKDARIALLKRRFCDARDAGGVMGISVCNPATAVEGRNGDVDFNGIMGPLTVSMNFADAVRTGPEENVLGLSANLYANDVFPPFPDASFNTDRGRTYALDQRAIAAKRSVATYSFGSIVGMKAGNMGALPPGSTSFVDAVLEQLGSPAGADSRGMIGESPSYYAQMELLTKKIYQQPDFYTNLYDAPANVERKSAAIRAIRLIQDMDRFNSVLRSEQNLSVLLELYIEDLQTDVINSETTAGE